MSFDGEVQDLMKKEPKTLSKIDLLLPVPARTLVYLG